MPQIYRRRTNNLRPKAKVGSYYRPMKRASLPMGLVDKFKMLPKRFRIILGASLLVVALVITGICLLSGGKGSPTLSNNGKPAGNTAVHTPTASDPTVSLPPRPSALAEPMVTPEAIAVRDISFGSMNLKSKEKLINQPASFGTELFYSAGSGALESKDDPLKKLYLYNIETGEEKKVATTKLAGGGLYETQVNTDWLVWLETDHHDKNYIYVQNRKTGDTTKIRECKNGKPKLRLAGDTLIWMEPVDKSKDQLMMVDLKTQENLILSTFTDLVTYGVSAPCIYVEQNTAAGNTPASTAEATPTPTPTPSPTPSNTPGATATTDDTSGEDSVGNTGSTANTTIVWAGPDITQTAEQKAADGDRSTIYWLMLGADAIMNDDGKLNTKSFSPGTYVHEPLYNGKYFVWTDGNYAPNSKLYISEPNGTPKEIADGITTYSLGDGIVVYGKQQQVWVYVIATGEYCRLTNMSEKGMLPYANGKTVLWYDKTDGSVDDKLRFKVLTDQDIAPGAN